LCFDVSQPTFKELRYRSLVGRDIGAALHLGKDSSAFLLRLTFSLAAGQRAPLNLALAGLRIAH
jgi:hypothetical protein